MKCQLVFLLGVFIKISFSSSEDTSDSETFIEGKGNLLLFEQKLMHQLNSTSGYLLCKSCGEDSAVLNLIDNSKISDLNLGLSNLTIGSKEVLVQDLRNPRGITFKVAISKRANCARTTGVS